MTKERHNNMNQSVPIDKHDVDIKLNARKNYSQVIKRT